MANNLHVDLVAYLRRMSGACEEGGYVLLEAFALEQRRAGEQVATAIYDARVTEALGAPPTDEELTAG